MKEEETLADKTFDRKLVLGDDISKIFAKHVKEKVQEFIRVLKKATDDENYDIMVKDGNGEISISLSEFINKLALDKFGEEILK